MQKLISNQGRMADVNPPPHVNAPPPTKLTNTDNVKHMLDEDLYSIDNRGNTTKHFTIQLLDNE
jgi:hypothetical protein